MFLTKSNELYVCGNNYQGQLALGDNKQQNTPEKLNISNIKQLSYGLYHSMALTESNEVYHSRGASGCEELGIGDKLNVANVKEIYCGSNYSMLVTYLNEVYALGDNPYGQLGVGDNEYRNDPTKIVF